VTGIFNGNMQLYNGPLAISGSPAAGMPCDFARPDPRNPRCPNYNPNLGPGY
jgi:hypothetical protein